MMYDSWKQHPAEPNIWVTPTGLIWRRINMTHPERRQWKLRKPEIDKDGYERICVKEKRYLVHRLVYALFVGELKNGLVVCHIDGKRANNHASNLLQATQKENISHKIGHGTHQVGEKHGSALITTKDAIRIKGLLLKAKRLPTGWLARGEAARIGAEVGASIHIVRDINRGKIWNHAVLGN